MKTIRLLFLSIAMITSYTLTAQVSITTDGSDPDSSAMLDIKSTTGGMLTPRMTVTERNAISNPATGLIVFVTNESSFYYWDGSGWAQFSTGGGSSGHYVGELMGTNGEDGVVFWADHTGQHGLICSKTDIDGGSGVQWYNGIDTITGATSDYDGDTNTTAIIVKQGAGTYAAKLCEGYSTPGTSVGDWYLPAIDELSKIYHAKYEINTALDTNSFAITSYWSSTEFDKINAWWYYFQYGNSSYAFKSITTYRVRAVRAF